jgi:hypothetical protein
MGDLRIVGTDADHLLLVDGDDAGATGHRVRIDAVREALRQAARAGESRLSPREIQDQLRLGIDADKIAITAGVSVERIRRWEGPVLAERAHALSRAQQTRFSRPPDGAVSGLLGKLVEQRLAQAGILPGWDAYRSPDGGWIIAATHEHATARWGFDGTTLTALDPHAEALGWREPPRAVDSMRARNRARTAIPSWEAIMENAPPPNAFPT